MIPPAKEYLNSQKKGYLMLSEEEFVNIINKYSILKARFHVKNFEKLLEESNITAKKYLELHVK